jgi:nucleotide-binding universal stress UspA family protein
VFSHIVVGSDGSSEGSDAVALGALIASATGARLSLVGVFPPSFLPVEGVSDRKTLRAQATQSLRGQRERLAPGAFVRTVADGSVARALRHYAERAHADLVIVGSAHGATPGHAAVGRTGRQLLYDAPFSLAVAARGLHEREPALGAIGVGYDDGPEARAALAEATDLAAATGARLLIRRVVEDRVPVLSPGQWIGLADWSHDDMWESERQNALTACESAAAELSLTADVSATIGDPGYEMRAFSKAVDLIVVGSRRWGPVARLVTGGVGETLVTDAGCSLLITPRPAGRSRRLRKTNRYTIGATGANTTARSHRAEASDPAPRV